MIKNNFDFLRLVFAFMVVLAHVLVLTQLANTKPLFFHIDSYLPVCGFFIISGFLITRSYSTSKSLADYSEKRARRLLPAYVVIIVASALLLVFASSLSFTSYFSSKSLFKYLALNLSFLNFLQPCLPGVFDNNNVMCAVNGSLWTLKVEVSFYIILPLIFYFIKKVRMPILVLILMYVLVLIHNFFLEHFLFQKNFNLYFTLSHQLPALMTYFISGMTLHFYFDFISKNKGVLALIATPLFVFEYIHRYQFSQPITLALLIFYFSYSPHFKFLNNFGKRGDFSYGIYIFHFPVIQVFVFLGMFNADHNRWLSFLILLLVVFLLAIFSWNFIEKRFLKSRAAHKKIIADAKEINN